MLTAKTRTAILALAASVSVALTAMAPAVSQAAKIDPYRNAYAKQQANKAPVTDECGSLATIYNADVRELAAAHESGSKVGVETFREAANDRYQEAFEMGCGWAA